MRNHLLHRTRRINQISRIPTVRYKTRRKDNMSGIITCKTSLEQFDKMLYAYRAEIDFNGLTYKFWKEYGPGRRLEIFSSNEMLPIFTYHFVIYGSEREQLPEELWESEQWTVFVLSPV